MLSKIGGISSMKFNRILVKNFKSIKELEIQDIENTLILVGKNNTGKSVIIDALCILTGEYVPDEFDYNTKGQNINIEVSLEFAEEDFEFLNKSGKVSKYNKYDLWKDEFEKKIPLKNKYILDFSCVVLRDGTKRFYDSNQAINTYLPEILPKIYRFDHKRDLKSIQDDIFKFQGNESLIGVRENQCMFDATKECKKCFNCIGLINTKKPEDLTIYETAKLLEYKMYNLNFNGFPERMNKIMEKNGSLNYEVKYSLKFNIDELLKVNTDIYNKDTNHIRPIETWSEGLKSVYLLSLFEAYSDEENKVPSIIILEEPEIYLHPQMQKVASEILYRLSKKNQVIFSTHSPNMIFNFSTKQIKQILTNDEHYTTVAENTDIDDILNDLGYGASDLMNVDFVFIVEGKQDRSRLPLLLEKYYSEIYSEAGKLKRISIIETNSCTNIKTYANLKYMNKAYLKDQFLMIRDSDGKNREMLKRQLCEYYIDREKYDKGNLPRITPNNVLVLKYYSFENYFLNPSVMTQIGVIKDEDEFYSVLWSKWREYLNKLKSSLYMLELTGIKIKSKADLKRYIEIIKTYVRGHNLFDIFYGKYPRNNVDEILKKYIEVAPKEDFNDILNVIDKFYYFDNRKK
jgi:AAA15 family ATPase/GTPase